MLPRKRKLILKEILSITKVFVLTLRKRKREIKIVLLILTKKRVRNITEKKVAHLLVTVSRKGQDFEKNKFI